MREFFGEFSPRLAGRGSQTQNARYLKMIRGAVNFIFSFSLLGERAGVRADVKTNFSGR